MSEPPPELYLTIRETARQYRSGTLSPLDLVRASLSRIDAVDPVLKAFVEVPRDEVSNGRVGGGMESVVAIEEADDRIGVEYYHSSRSPSTCSRKAPPVCSRPE